MEIFEDSNKKMYLLVIFIFFSRLRERKMKVQGTVNNTSCSYKNPYSNFTE